MIVNTEPAERDDVSMTPDDGVEVLTDWSVGVDCWSSVEDTVGEAASEPRVVVADASSGGGLVLV